MENNSNHYDAIVMGGGPAGSSIASILAREGRKVILFEKEEFPRHHIGESLMTDTYWTFQRMGILEKLKQSPFVRKYSVQFANSAGRESRPFYFFEANHHESAGTWQVTRSEFDKFLLAHSEELGVNVNQGTPVKRVLFDGDRAVGVEVIRKDGSLQTFHAKVIVDATGQQAILSNKFGWRGADPKEKRWVLLSHFKGPSRRAGPQRRRDSRSANRAGQRRMVLVYPARERHYQRRHRCRSRLSLQGPWKRLRKDTRRRNRKMRIVPAPSCGLHTRRQGLFDPRLLLSVEAVRGRWLHPDR